MTKQAIMNMTIEGNAYHDRGIFNAVHDYVMDKSNNIKDRADVLEWMETKVMGEESERCTEFFPTDTAYVMSYTEGL